jgi:hypothetical protein
VNIGQDIQSRLRILYGQRQGTLSTEDVEPDGPIMRLSDFGYEAEIDEYNKKLESK